MPRKLQLAIDLPDLKEALDVLRRVEGHVDVFEVGTPLITSVGVRAIADVRRIVGSRPVVADLKIMDNAELHAQLAFDQGADGIIVQAAAPDATIRAAYEFCRGRQKNCFIDSLGLPLADFIARTVAYPAAIPIFHAGIDEQANGYFASDIAESTEDHPIPQCCAIAGGISLRSIRLLVTYPFLENFIVGTAIMKSGSPADAAREFSRALREAS